MKKILLFVAVTTASIMASAQAPSPYPYSSFKKNETVPVPTYSIPDAAITSATTLDAVASAVASTQNVGLQCVNFDQVNASVASAYATDYLKTCGPTSSAFAEAATNSAIRGWALDEVTPFVAGSIYSTKNEPFIGFNANPSTFRFSGGWYYYTVNFTEAAEYEFFLRIRSGAMRASKTVAGSAITVDKIVTVQLYNKTDMANPIQTWLLNYGGISVSAAPPTTAESDDKSVKFFAWAKQTAGVPTAGQSGSFWSKAATTYTIPSVGEYVIKITDPTLKVENQDTAPAAGDTNNAIGSFTFIKKTPTGTKNINTVHALATVVGKDIKVSANVQSVEVYNLTGSKLKSGKIEGNQFRIETAGVYMIKMITAEGNKIQKVVIK